MVDLNNRFKAGENIFNLKDKMLVPVKPLILLMEQGLTVEVVGNNYSDQLLRHVMMKHEESKFFQKPVNLPDFIIKHNGKWISLLLVPETNYVVKDYKGNEITMLSLGYIDHLAKTNVQGLINILSEMSSARFKVRGVERLKVAAQREVKTESQTKLERWKQLKAIKSPTPAEARELFTLALELGKL